MARTVLAQKGKLRKRFPIETWELLNNKNGWIAIETPDQIVKNDLVVPDSGQMKNPIVKQIVVNEAIPKTPDQIVKNDLVVESLATKEFVDFAKQELTKTRIKDYFDSEEGKTVYKNNMSFDALIELLAVKFNNSIFSTKEAFKIDLSL